MGGKQRKSIAIKESGSLQRVQVTVEGMISKEQPLAKGILLGTCIPNDREREGSHGKAARKRYPAPSSLQGTERAAGREMAVSRADPTLPHRETLEARQGKSYSPISILKAFLTRNRWF